MDHSQVLRNALAFAQQHQPEASPQKHAAFATAVAEMVTGISGGYGGPSVREHAVGRTYGARRFPYEEACRLLISSDGLIFGPIRQIHKDVYEEEYCFDDDPEDIRELEGSGEL